MGDGNGKSVLYEKISVEYLLGAFGLATAFSTALSILSLFPGGEAIFLRVVPVRPSLPSSWLSASF